MAAASTVTPGERLAQLAADDPDGVAVVVGQVDGADDVLTWGQLEEWSNRVAHLLVDRGVDADSFVAIQLPNSVEHVVASCAVLKQGACAMPLDHRMPRPERDAMLELGAPTVVISDGDGLPGAIPSGDLAATGHAPTPPAHYPVPDPWKALGSGGSTGRKKLIVSTGAFAFPPGAHPIALLGRTTPDDVVHVTGPLYHNQAFLVLHATLFAGATTVLAERFRPELTYRLIAEHGVTVLNTVPTIMQRLARHDPDRREDLSSVRMLWHMAAMCPDWLKREWIDRLGPGAVIELWGATEMTGLCIIDGEEWLEHPGSVGRGWHTEVRILDEDGAELPPGEVGQLWTRLAESPPGYRYLGADPLPTDKDGFAWVGDLASVDEDGYVHLADRRVDLVITGGHNVYPAEVEAAISADPRVADVAVVGLPDDDLGRVVHAVVERAAGADVDADEVIARCRDALAAYKVPRDVTFVERLPRDDAGKIRRRALVDDVDARAR